jgi:hypothetical protein
MIGLAIAANYRVVRKARPRLAVAKLGNPKIYFLNTLFNVLLIRLLTSKDRANR